MAAGLISKDILRTWVVAVSLALWLVPAAAGEKVEVMDPYIELHTGPGRGYPIFYVAARHEWVKIKLRHTDWFLVRTEGGKEGWVSRQQIEATLTQIGTKTTFRDVFVDQYLRRRLEFGAAWGHFKSEPMLKVWVGYRFMDTLAVEATGGQVQGVFSGTDLWHVNLLAEPIGGWRRTWASASAGWSIFPTRAWSARSRPAPASPTRRWGCAIAWASVSSRAWITRSIWRTSQITAPTSTGLSRSGLDSISEQFASHACATLHLGKYC